MMPCPAHAWQLLVKTLTNRMQVIYFLLSAVLCFPQNAMFFGGTNAAGPITINTTPIQHDIGAINTFSVAFGSNNAAGDLVTVFYDNEAGGDHATGVTDTVGNSYTLAGTSTNGSIRMELWYAKNIGAGANTVTVAITGGLTHGYVAIQEWSQASLTAPLDVFAASSSTGTAGPVTTTGNNELLLIGFSDGGGNTPCSSGYTTIDSASFYTFVIFQRKAAGAAGSYSGTSCGAGNIVAVMAAFK